MYYVGIVSSTGQKKTFPNDLLSVRIYLNYF